MDARHFKMIMGALLLAAAPATYSAEANPHSASKPVTCTAGTAETLSVAQISAHPDKYQLHCVKIVGINHQSFLYENVDGIYLRSSDGLNPASNGLRLGLDNLHESVSDAYQHVVVIGRVQDCETTRGLVHANDSEGEIVMVLGYCHYFNGPYLWVQSIEPRSGPVVERRLARSGRFDYGDLEPAPRNWQHRKKIEGLAHEFLEALGAGNRERLAGMHFRDVGLERADDEVALIKFLLDSPESPFATFRNLSTPQQIILLEKPPLQWLEDDRDENSDNYASTVCFCRKADCSGLWPIAAFDADNLPTRPYACTTIFQYYTGDSQPLPWFRTPINTEGLAEPAATTP